MSNKNQEAPKVLLVDDEKNLVIMLAKILRRNGFEVETAHDGEEGLQLLEQCMPDPQRPEDSDQPTPVDILLTDLQMPKMDGMTLLKEVSSKYPQLPIIVLTGHGSIQSAVEAMKEGARDYLIKPANPDELLIVLKNTLEMRNLQVENRQLKSQLRQNYEPSYDIVGSSPAISHVMEMVESVSRNRSTVLITGESGTGKELIARAIHDSGPYARYPFIAVNCGALSETLLESQLFGHKRGAFTGAINDHQGFFQAAEGGTLFLDEISEMSTHLQVKLLRALQEKEIIAVGDNQTQKINCRLIVATNRDLEFEVRRRNFRQDLFFRLSIVNLYLAPLRERAEDIPDLAGHFILQFAREYDVAPKSVQPEAMEILVNYPWPGNIRELQNVIERCFALSKDETVKTEDLPPQLFRSREEAMVAVRPMDDSELKAAGAEGSSSSVLSSRSAPNPTSTVGANGGDFPKDEVSAEKPKFTEPFVPKAPETPLTLDEMEKKQIIEALRRSKGKKVDAAKLLGIDRKRLYRKMKKYELD